MPDSYTLTPPDGVTIDAGLIASMTPAFKAAKLTNEQAQGLVSAFVAAVSPAKSMAAQLEATMKDPEVGQMNWGRTQGLVNKALLAFTTPEDRTWMEKVAGVGNRLEFVRMFARIGKAMSADTPASGSPTSATPRTTASKLYGGGDLVSSSKE